METLKRLKSLLQNKFISVSLLFTIYLVYTKCIDFLYNNLGEFSISVLEALIITPIWEEAVYRYGPIEIIGRMEKSLKIDKFYILTPAIIVVSLMFGFNHDGTAYNVLIQGVLGIILSIVYLYLTKYKFLTIVILHGIWNTLVLYFNF